MRYAKSRREAEDMLQDAFYGIFKDLKQYSGQGSIMSWMRKVTVNASLMYIRKHRKMIVSALETEELDNIRPVDEDLMHADRAQAIVNMIRDLPEIQQVVFNLRAMEEYSFKEIASMIGGNEATLRSYYLRARKTLQDMLTKEFMSNE